MAKLTHAARADIRGSRFTNERDTFRKRSYRWENEEGKASVLKRLPNRQAAKGFSRLCMKVGVRRLAAMLQPSDEAAREALASGVRASFSHRFTKDDAKTCFAGINGVYFARWGWTTWIIAHEVAHFIDAHEAQLKRNPRAGHGPDWLGWYVFLLVEVAGEDRARLEASLEAAKLKFVSKWSHK